MTETKIMVTSGLRRNDVVAVHGMRVQLVAPLPTDDPDTIAWDGRVTNVQEAIQHGVPASLIRGGQWTIQGTDARAWPVIRTAKES